MTSIHRHAEDLVSRCGRHPALELAPAGTTGTPYRSAAGPGRPCGLRQAGPGRRGLLLHSGLFAVPALWSLPELPKTPSGKLQRSALRYAQRRSR